MLCRIHWLCNFTDISKTPSSKMLVSHQIHFTLLYVGCGPTPPSGSQRTSPDTGAIPVKVIEWPVATSHTGAEIFNAAKNSFHTAQQRRYKMFSWQHYQTFCWGLPYVCVLEFCDGSMACNPSPHQCVEIQCSKIHGCMTNGGLSHIIFHCFITVNTMVTCTTVGPFKGPFLSIICCALDVHQLTPVMSCAQ